MLRPGTDAPQLHARPDRAWLLAANQDSDDISVFQRDADSGQLTPVRRHGLGADAGLPEVRPVVCTEGAALAIWHLLRTPVPRPWTEDSEHRLLKEALDQVELADRLGIDYAWEVEHHFLEEYSHSSTPEVFLAACSQRTSQIRLGHGIVLMPSGFNHPARVAERIATLDLISDGRVEWGTGSSSSRSELEGFGIDPEQKHLMWEESVREAAKMMVMEPYAGFDGQSFAMPPRNVVPKPL